MVFSIATSAAREILLLRRPLFGVGTGFDALSILNATAGGIWRNRKIQTVVLLIELLIAFVVSVQRFYAVPLKPHFSPNQALGPTASRADV